MSTSTEPTTIQVYLGPRSYEIAIVDSQLDEAPRYLALWRERLVPRQSAPGMAVIVTDRNVRDPHAHAIANALRDAGWQTGFIELEAGERSKNLDVVVGMYDRMVELSADRHTVVIAVGGGVVGDSAGFLAATYTRGAPFVQIPTSLLAMVDSSVGGKVGVNLPQAKNLVGAFHQPLGVLIDLSVLSTLPDREYRSGLAEVIKYGVIQDASFFKFLEDNVGGLNARDPQVMRHIIARSCRLKADVVEQDEYERTGLRAILNYGHTFAHAFEALAGYGELLHGEAVAIGMTYAARLAEALGRIDAELTRRQAELLQAVGLSTTLPAACRFSSEEVLSTMRLDKKTVGGQLRFVLPTELGHVEVVKNVPEAAVRSVLVH